MEDQQKLIEALESSDTMAIAALMPWGSQTYCDAKSALVGYQAGLAKSQQEIETLKQDVENEQADVAMIATQASKVYDHLTRGRLSKPTYDAEVIIGVVEEIQNSEINEAVAELEKENEELKAKLYFYGIGFDAHQEQSVSDNESCVQPVSDKPN